MARRPSTLSVSTPPPSSAGPYQLSKGTSRLSPLPTFQTPTSSWTPRNASFLTPSRHLHGPPVENPDELFTRLTVSEVMHVHRRLLCVIPPHNCLRLFTLTLSSVRQGRCGRQARRTTAHGRVRTRILHYLVFLELEFESAGNATATSCRHHPPLYPSRSLHKIPWTPSKTSSYQFRPRYLR